MSDDYVPPWWVAALNRATTVVMVVAVVMAAAVTVALGARGSTGAATGWLVWTGLFTAYARWRPPLITVRKTQETD